MKYKNMLVALAATVTIGVTPALTSVNVNAKANPKVTSTYWQKTVRYVTLTKNIKANKAKIVDAKVNGQTTKQLSLVKNPTRTLKKGYKTYIRYEKGTTKNNGVWILINVGKNNKATYYVVNDSKLVKNANWLKITKQKATTNSSSSNSSSNADSSSSSSANSANSASSSSASTTPSKAKQVVTVNSNYQTAANDLYMGTSFGTAFVSANSKAFTSNGVTINPGDKQQVSVVNTGTADNPVLLYQIQVNGQTITVPQSSDLFFTNINVFPVSTSSSSSNSSSGNTTTVYASEYTPDSSDAVVSKSFKPVDGTRWMTLPNFNSSSQPTNIYTYIAAQNKWVKGHIENNTLKYDYQDN